MLTCSAKTTLLSTAAYHDDNAHFFSCDREKAAESFERMWVRLFGMHMCMGMGIITRGCVVDTCDECGGCMAGWKGYVPILPAVE